MDSKAFKKLIKESVREVIQEELREILLEAVRSPKQPLTTYTPPPTYEKSPTPSLTTENRRQAYMNILGETANQFTTQDVVPPFNPQGVMPGSDLPAGELNMSQIMNLMNK